MPKLTKPCPYCSKPIPDSGVFGLPTYTDVPENHAPNCSIREIMEVSAQQAAAPDRLPAAQNDDGLQECGRRAATVRQTAQEESYMPEWVMKVAQALLDEWTIGSYSRFCDEIDFDSATVEEIAEVIWREFQAAQAGAVNVSPVGTADDDLEEGSRN